MVGIQGIGSALKLNSGRGSRRILGNPGQDRLCGTACVELEVLPRGVLSMIPFAYSELFPRGA